MIAHETIEINGKQYKRTYSTVGAVVRCGRKSYVTAVDPIDVDKVYFEEGVENEQTDKEES